VQLPFLRCRREVGLGSDAIDQTEEPNVKTHTSKAMGVAAAVAALAVSLPLAINAQADDPVVPKPPADPQGNCDPVRAELATSGTNLTQLATMPLGQAISKIPSLSTFYSAISGGLNPAVNVVPVLENGPYVVFAPNNDAFAKLDPAELETLKTDPAALSKLDYYHAFLGLVGPDLVQGVRPSQEGTDITIKGKGGDIKVNDSAKVICGGITGVNSRIYIIDTVLDPATGGSISSEQRSSMSASASTTTTTSSAAPSEQAPPPEG
jgi:uncharacterized surface protein with fasciclin (FAS1) repeats